MKGKGDNMNKEFAVFGLGKFRGQRGKEPDDPGLSGDCRGP